MRACRNSTPTLALCLQLMNSSTCKISTPIWQAKAQLEDQIRMRISQSLGTERWSEIGIQLYVIQYLSTTGFESINHRCFYRTKRTMVKRLQHDHLLLVALSGGACRSNKNLKCMTRMGLHWSREPHREARESVMTIAAIDQRAAALVRLSANGRTGAQDVVVRR